MSRLYFIPGLIWGSRPRQSLIDMGTLQDEVDSLLRHCVRMIAKVDRALLAQAQELGWTESIARCRAIPGIGPLTAMALVATWHRGAFSNVDAFVAFLGLDVLVIGGLLAVGSDRGGAALRSSSPCYNIV